MPRLQCIPSGACLAKINDIFQDNNDLVWDSKRGIGSSEEFSKCEELPGLDLGLGLNRNVGLLLGFELEAVEVFGKVALVARCRHKPL